MTPRILLPQFWRLLAYQPFMATIGVWLQQAPYLEKVIYGSGRRHRPPADARVYSERFRDPVWRARAGTPTEPSWCANTAAARHPETRRATVPIRALFGTADFAVHPSLADPRPRTPTTTRSNRRRPHFVVDERPDLVRAKLIALAEETGHS